MAHSTGQTENTLRPFEGGRLILGAFALTSVVDEVVVSGQLTLCQDRQGLAWAQILRTSLDHIVAALAPRNTGLSSDGSDLDKRCVPTPFDDQAFSFGGLTVESASDHVAFYGEVCLRPTIESLALATAMRGYLDQVVAALTTIDHARPLPERAALLTPIRKANPLA